MDEKIEALREKAARPMAWRCYDKAIDAWSVTCSVGLIESRSRHPNDWIIEPLYSEADSLSLLSERDRLRAALAEFTWGDQTVADLLWGDMPDDKIMTFQISLGAYRRARAALTRSET